MKKWVSIFLLLLVATGNFIPCCAKDDCATEVSAATDAGGHSDDDGTGCSPFFACGTCAPAIVVHTPVPVSELPSLKKESYRFVTDDGLSQYHPSFFQPPRQ
ncbi:MAG: hypothetical protein QM781_13595 [Chitinophagaceae bacterium]